MLWPLFLVKKNYWLLLHWHHKKNTRIEKGEKDVHAGIKEAKPERGPHGFHKAALVQNLNWKKNYSKLTKAILRDSKCSEHGSSVVVWETQFADLGWPVMWWLQISGGGWGGGNEYPTGASSQTHGLRHASNLKEKWTRLNVQPEQQA